MLPLCLRNADLLKQKVQHKFAEVRAALEVRERLLLRQIDVIDSQHVIWHGGGGQLAEIKNNNMPYEHENIEFCTEQEDELFGVIRSFGRFRIENMNLTLQDLYLKSEDYIAPCADHETFYKCLGQAATEPDMSVEVVGQAKVKADSAIEQSKQEPQLNVSEFDVTNNRSILENNAKNINESIISITLKESKELIQKFQANDDNPIAAAIRSDELNYVALAADVKYNKSSQTSCVLQNTQQSILKPKITINNCNGTINLKNISNLIINCGAGDVKNSNKPNDFQLDNSLIDANDVRSSSDDQLAASSQSKTLLSDTSIGDYSNSSSRLPDESEEECRPAIRADFNTDHEEFYDANANANINAATYDFYNRLLNEIKSSLQEQRSKPLAADDGSAIFELQSSDHSARSPTTSTPNTKQNRRFILKNFENLKVILEANSEDDSFRPVQIEQWLAEIISDTDLEPMQDTDILEHSEIHI